MNCNTQDEEERCEIYLAFKDHSYWWRISALFFDTGEICEVRLHTVTCLALNDVGKQHQTNNEPPNHTNGYELSLGYTGIALR